MPLEHCTRLPLSSNVKSSVALGELRRHVIVYSAGKDGSGATDSASTSTPRLRCRRTSSLALTSSQVKSSSASVVSAPPVLTPGRLTSVILLGKVSSHV